MTSSCLQAWELYNSLQSVRRPTHSLTPAAIHVCTDTFMNLSWVQPEWARVLRYIGRHNARSVMQRLVQVQKDVIRGRTGKQHGHSTSHGPAREWLIEQLKKIDLENLGGQLHMMAAAWQCKASIVPSPQQPPGTMHALLLLLMPSPAFVYGVRQCLHLQGSPLCMWTLRNA